jgi:hypothetical protein
MCRSPRLSFSSHLAVLSGVLAGLVCVGAASVLAQDARPLAGEVFVAGATPLDPPAGEAADTHAYVSLNGEGAVAIYGAMQAAEIDDLCRGEGWKLKNSGPLVCSFHAPSGEAACDFSLDLVSGSLDEGIPC